MYLSTLAFITALSLFAIGMFLGYKGGSNGHSEANLLAYIMLSTAFICKSIEQLPKDK